MGIPHEIAMLWAVACNRFYTVASLYDQGDLPAAVGTQVTLDKRLKVVTGRNRPKAPVAFGRKRPNAVIPKVYESGWDAVRP